MQFLMLALLGALVGQGMRRIRMLRHVGQMRAARSLYGRYALLLGGAALCAMGGQLALLGVNGMLHLGTALPLHLCSLMGVLLYPALRCGSRRLWEISLYLGVPGGMGALLFPAILSCDQPMLMAFCFHLLHCTVVIGPWLPLSLGWRPRPSGAAVAFGFLFLHACVALSLNHLAGTNYLFLNLPVAGTPLAALGRGSHGAYVASLGAMAAALLSLEGLLAARALRRWPESFPLPLNWREELDRGRHMG